MNRETPIQARVTQRFTVSVEQVFDAWLNPDLISQWMFGPALRDEEVVQMTVDGRVGGAFSFVVRRQGIEIDHVGEYLEIDRPRRLVFTWDVRGHLDDESRVIIDITALDQGCELTLIHEMAPQWAEFAERSREAWAKMIGVLADKLTTTAPQAVECTIWIAAPRERVWQAITDAEQLTRWYATQFAWEIPTLAVGATVKFYSPDTTQLITIEVVDPPRQFTLRWHSQPELITTFLLEEENDGTRVTMRESGYAAVPAAARQQWLDATGASYVMSMENLKAHIEGRSLPY
jgi:uncharacterized protein YndB with AHSA1/START domain